MHDKWPLVGRVLKELRQSLSTLLQEELGGMVVPERWIISNGIPSLVVLCTTWHKFKGVQLATHFTPSPLNIVS